MIVIVRVEFSDADRLALRERLGKSGLATRAELRQEIESSTRALFDVFVSEATP